MFRIAFAACVTLVVWPVISAAQEAAPRVERTKDPSMSAPAISVAGEVLSSDGKPLAGANVVLRAKLGGTQYTFGLRHNRDVLARTETDAQGKFSFEKIGLPRRMTDQIDNLRSGKAGAELVVWAKDHAIYWVDVKSFEPVTNLSVKLAAETPLSGELVDEAGKPVADAKVGFYGMTKATRSMDGFLHEPGDLNLNSSELDFSVRSDAEGRFQLAHVPADYRLLLYFNAPNVARKLTIFNSGAASDLKEMKTEGGSRESIEMQGSPMKVTLKHGQDVIVKVRDAEGQPVTDGGIEVILENRTYGGSGELGTDGTVRIPLRETGKLTFHYGGDPLYPRLGTRVEAEIKAGNESPTVEIQLPKSRRASGQVLDAETGQPVEGVYLHYAAGEDGKKAELTAYSGFVSGADGRFQFPALEGPGRVYYSRATEGYYPPCYENVPDRREGTSFQHAVNVPSEGDAAPIVLKVGHGLVVRGMVRDANGKPAAGVHVRGDNSGSSLYTEVSAITNDAGQFELAGISPHVKARIAAHGVGGAAELSLDGQPDFPWDKSRIENVELKLARGVRLTGRVLKDGKPLAGIRMKLDKHVPVGEGRSQIQPFGETATDADGHYAVGGLAPGDGYDFEIIAPDGMVAPDWRHQRPYVQKVPDTDVTEVKLPDVNLITAGQTLRGVVVDPAGNPVPEITVSPRVVKGDFISRSVGRRAPWMTTDENGQFEITDLPDLPIELMAYKSNAKGGRIRNSSKVQPKRNQQDIRIVFDPTLDAEIEDLDK